MYNYVFLPARVFALLLTLRVSQTEALVSSGRTFRNVISRLAMKLGTVRPISGQLK